MTIEEAIKHCEEVAVKRESDVAYYRTQNDKEWLAECESHCIECANGYRQLAEWLKKLKAYESDNEICKYCTHTDDADYCDICKHSTILVDYFDLEVNADDGNSN